MGPGEEDHKDGERLRKNSDGAGDETRHEEGYAATNEEKASDRPETFSEAN